MTNSTVPLAVRTANKLLGKTSCVGCQYMYMHDTGYSNYTVLNTEVRCALDKNPNLPADAPYDWAAKHDGSRDNWPKTNESRCEKFLPFRDGGWHPAEFSVEAAHDGVYDGFMALNTQYDPIAKQAIYNHVQPTV